MTFLTGRSRWSPTGKPVAPSTTPVRRNPEREPPALAWGRESKGRYPGNRFEIAETCRYD